MAVSPELAAVLCTGFLSVAGVVIAALLNGKKKGSADGTVCPQHSGITTDIKNIYHLLQELKVDVKRLLEQGE